MTGISGSEDLHTSGDDVNLLLAVINPVIMDNVENKQKKQEVKIWLV